MAGTGVPGSQMSVDMDGLHPRVRTAGRTVRAWAVSGRR